MVKTGRALKIGRWLAVAACICCVLWLAVYVLLASRGGEAGGSLLSKFEAIKDRHAQIVSIKTQQDLYVLVELSDEPSAMQAERIAAEILEAETAVGHFVYVNFYVGGRFVFQLYKDRAAGGKFVVSGQDFY